MLSTRKITFGQKGAKRLYEQYGERLYSVHYRDDHPLRKRSKTVELIVEETAWTPPPPHYTPARKWYPARELWELRYDQVYKLRLKSRIQKPAISDNTNR